MVAITLSIGFGLSLMTSLINVDPAEVCNTYSAIVFGGGVGGLSTF